MGKDRLAILHDLYKVRDSDFYTFNNLMCFLVDNTGITDHKKAIMALNDIHWHKFRSLIKKAYDNVVS